MRHGLLLALTLGVTPLALCACDGAPVEAAPYEDGTRKLTNRGAFHVELWSESGQPQLGPNTFYVEVAMPDPADPLALGRGIPDARVHVTAFTPNADGATEATLVHYLGDGRYQVEGLDFDQPGVWTLDVDIEVGQSMDEQASFSFEL